MKEEAFSMAKKAFEIEAQAIKDTKEAMDWEAFEKAVVLLSRANKIATSGCGHSGIACRHFAHSMCCIERPARFIAPGEALHGGSGFLQAGDVFVAASRGGKTAELIPMIEIARKKNVSVITITENLDSAMARLSDVVLPMSIKKEADRGNLQGTSSFVALSAVFDALQVATIEETGFCGELQFGLIHPGGAVGQKLNKS
ncbi:MAG: SIS domain-containing protein [Oscillospiraceae bacterium]|nr:SIS domain-containing protein [Oscillospiraceae bacterium]MCL2160054.1 SIS domain-containing protein [Oscillospiraceae bacterium]